MKESLSLKLSNYTYRITEINSSVTITLNISVKKRLDAASCTCQLRYENNAAWPRVKKFFTNENI